MQQLIILFFFYFIFVFSASGYSEGMYSNDMDDFLKGISSVPALAESCKSEWSGEGCNIYDRKILMKYILYFCGEIPEDTHPINRQWLTQYISYPMLSAALIRGWSWLNSDITWPRCVVCFLNYPSHPYWERNISFCNE